MYGHLFSQDMEETFSELFRTDASYVPVDVETDPDYRAARMLVPHGAVVLGAQRQNCTSHRGERYGRLTVLYDQLPKDGEKSRKMHCLCKCGKEKDIDYDSLTSKRVLSCGCFLKSKSDPERKALNKEAAILRRMEKTDPAIGSMCKSLRCVGVTKMCGKYRFVPCECTKCGRKAWYDKRGFLHDEANCTCFYRWKFRDFGKWELHPDSFGLTVEDVTTFFERNPFPES